MNFSPVIQNKFTSFRFSVLNAQNFNSNLKDTPISVLFISFILAYFILLFALDAIFKILPTGKFSGNQLYFQNPLLPSTCWYENIVHKILHKWDWFCKQLVSHLLFKTTCIWDVKCEIHKDLLCKTICDKVFIHAYSFIKLLLYDTIN